MNKLRSNMANAAVAAAISSVSLAPGAAQAEIPEQQINNFQPQNPTVSVESLKAKLAQFDGGSKNIAISKPVPQPNMDAVPAEFRDRFKKSFETVQQAGNNSSPAYGEAVTLPFSYPDAKEAVEKLGKTKGQPIHAISLRGNDGKMYNIVSSGGRYGSKAMPLDQAFAGQSAPTPAAFVQRPVGQERYTGNATNVGGRVTEAAPAVGDAPPPTAKRTFVLDAKGKVIGYSDGTPLNSGPSR